MSMSMGIPDLEDKGYMVWLYGCTNYMSGEVEK